MVDRAEYKRRQAPPGIRITPQGLRPRPAPADHQPLRRLSAAALRRGDGDRHPRRAQTLPSSSVISTSQTQVVRPRWRGRGGGVDVAVADRAQEGRVVGLPHRHHPLVVYRAVGGRRGEALGERGEDAAVDDAVGLAGAGLDRDAGAGVSGSRMSHSMPISSAKPAGLILGLGHAAAP